MFLLVLQTSFSTIGMRYSRTVRPEGEKGPLFLSSATVVIVEAVKLPVCLCAAAYQLRRHNGLVELLRRELLFNPVDTLKCAVPALCYTIQGNLLYTAVQHLEAPTFQVIYQCKTVFTCIFAYLCLSKRLTARQWLAILLLILGTILASDVVGSFGAKSRSHDAVASKRHTGDSRVMQALTHALGLHAESLSWLIGVSATLASAVLSAASSVYFERLLKAPASDDAAVAGLWLRNIQLGIFALPLSSFVMIAQDGKQLHNHGMLHGFNWVVWLCVFLNSGGGLLVAAVMKYAGNVEKCFATSVSIVVSALLSVPCFGWQPNRAFTAGAMLTCAATCYYAYLSSRPTGAHNSGHACGGSQVGMLHAEDGDTPKLHPGQREEEMPLSLNGK